jgi:hypothetical protein
MNVNIDMEARQQEVGSLEDEIISFWQANDGRLPHAAFVALMVSAKIACDPGRFTDTEVAAADRALGRLREAAAAVRS